jgi:SWI/SNF-related matrix-associated actin-dependent regulator of chromatin subfamily A-like protein 1
MNAGHRDRQIHGQSPMETPDARPVTWSRDMGTPVSAYMPLSVNVTVHIPNQHEQFGRQPDVVEIDPIYVDAPGQEERINIPDPACLCSEPETAVRKTVAKESANKGRLFWVCAKPRTAQCKYFEWDDEIQSRHKRLLSGPGSTTESPTKMRRLSPGSVTVNLEQIRALSAVITDRLSPELVAALKSLPNSEVQKLEGFNQSKIVFPLSELDAVEKLAIKHHVRFSCAVPQNIIRGLRAYERRERTRAAAGDTVTTGLDEILPALMCDKIMEFQWEGIHFALRRGGRCLIGDDMGLGKTLQAIAVARIYRRDWPLLIVCPSSLRLNWKEELLTWLGEDLEVSEINVAMKGQDCDRRLEAVNIVSYELVQKIPMRELRRCNFIIADESHYLKSADTKRTKFLTPLIRDSRRALLLSGTPALSRPVELFSQINALEPELFPSYHDFTERYCNARQARWGWDVSGSSNLEELHTLLRGSCLIRRRKDDVLTQLPPKQRQVVWVEPKASIMKEVRKAQDELHGAQAAMDQASSEGEALACNNAFRAANNKMYTLTGEAKVDAVKQFLKDTLEGAGKLIVFGHHKEVIKALNEFVTTKLKVETIVIDGDTPQAARQGLCHSFQNKPACRAAILSITAAGVGLTLTAASVVIFAELYWNPGSLLQAEDRAHRIGQRDCVLVKYLLARETLDESMWNTVRKKMTVVGKSLTGSAAQMAVVGDAKRGDGKSTIDKYFRSRIKRSQDEDIVEVIDYSPESSSAFEQADQMAPSSHRTDRVTQGRIVSSRSGDSAVNLDSDDEIFPLRIRKSPSIAAVYFGNKIYYDADLALARSLQQQFDAEAAAASNRAQFWP